jgi:PAS domain S-box-containing protein
MAGEKSAATPDEVLQRRVERFLAGQDPGPGKMSLEEVRSLVHDLHVHQLDLEAQNAAWRRRQEQLEASHRNLAEWFDFTPVGYFTFDREGLIVDVNLTGTAALGVAKEFLLNRPFSGFVEPELQSTFQAHLQQVFSGGGKPQCRLQLLPQGGAPFLASLQSMAVRDHRGHYSLCRTVVSDISGRSRLAEAALRESHERLTALLESAPDPIFFKDAQGRYLVINQAGAESLGLRKEDCIGKTDAQLLPPGTAERFGRNDGELLEKRQPTLAEVYMTDIKDQKRIFQAVKFPLFDDQGQIRGIGCIARDITPRRAAEEALRRSEANLQTLFDTVQDFIWVLYATT